MCGVELRLRLTDVNPVDDRFTHWIAALEAKHFAELTFPEVSRSLRALSSNYVERRHKLGGRRGAVWRRETRRVRPVLRPSSLSPPRAYHRASTAAPRLLSRRWSTLVAAPARPAPRGRQRASRRLGWSGSTDIHGRWVKRRRPIAPSGFQRLCARATSQTPRCPRVRRRSSRRSRSTSSTMPIGMRCSTRLLKRGTDRDRVLIVEPLAGFVARWWNRWRDAFEAAGGRTDEWRLRTELPPIVAKLDRAAGLNHREITGRSLWLPGK